jgi:hypothetical protein
MKWIKLFEEYSSMSDLLYNRITKNDKIKSANIIAVSFFLKKEIAKFDLQKVEKADKTFYYSTENNTTIIRFVHKRKIGRIYCTVAFMTYLYRQVILDLDLWDLQSVEFGGIVDGITFDKAFRLIYNSEMYMIDEGSMAELINESLKSIPVIAGLAAGLAIGNPQAHSVEKPKTELTKTAWHEKIEMAKKNVIEKVNRNKNITNKDTIIDRIKTVHIDEYKTKQTTTLMYYYFDTKKKIDVVMINTAKVDSSNVYQTLVHELNHLVDQHKAVIKTDEVVVKNISREEFGKYFNGWRQVDKKGKKYSISDLWTPAYARGKSYFLSDVEVKARLSSLYQFLLDNDLLKAGDKLNSKHIEKMKEWINIKFPQGVGEEVERSYNNFLRNDFIPILPLIDWSKEEAIDLIVKKDDLNYQHFA